MTTSLKKSACRPCGESAVIDPECVSDSGNICGDQTLFSIHTERAQRDMPGPGVLVFLPYHKDEEDSFVEKYVLVNMPKSEFDKLDFPPEAYLFYFVSPESDFTTLVPLMTQLAFGRLRNAYEKENYFKTESFTRVGWEIVSEPTEPKEISTHVRLATHPSYGVKGCCDVSDGYFSLVAHGVYWMAGYPNDIDCEETSDKDKEKNELDCMEIFKIKTGSLKDEVNVNRAMWSTNTKEALKLKAVEFKQGRHEFEQRKPIDSPYAIGPITMPALAIKKDQTKLPVKHELFGNVVPYNNDKQCKAFLLGYLNKSGGSNYTINKDRIGTTHPWRFVMQMCKKFSQTVEKSRDLGENNIWYHELGFLGLETLPFDRFYLGMCGNEEELWVFAFLGGDNVRPANADQLKLYSGAYATQLPGFMKAKNMVLMMYNDYKMEYNNLCDLPVFRDCKANPDQGSLTTPTSFCAGRASTALNSFCGNEFFAMQRAQQDSFIESYCDANRKSSECACFNRTDNEMFRYMTREHGDKLVVHDSCWWKPCFIRDRGMFIHSSDNKQCDSEVRFNILWLENLKDVDLSGLTQVALEKPVDQGPTESEKFMGIFEIFYDTWMLVLSVLFILLVLVLTIYAKSSGILVVS